MWNGGYSTVNNIDLICAISIRLERPWLLLLLIPALGLMLWPFFRLSKKHRKTRNRIVSLVLHSLVLLFCVSMLAGMTFHLTTVSIKNDVILLVDASASTEKSQDDMNGFIRSVLDEAGSDYDIGVVTFANGCVYASRMSNNADNVYNNYINSERPLANASDISSALLYARDLLSSPKNGRIILLSDGVETDGNALAAVRILADEGTRVDTVYFSPQPHDGEVQITSLELPERVAVGDTVQAVVTMQSAAAGTATLQLFDNGEMRQEQEVSLGGGTDVYTFDYTVLSPGLHEFYVTISAEGDTLTENNRYYSYINIETYTQVLIVDGGGESAQLSALLGETYDVTTVSVRDVPTTLEGLSEYDEVILMNVANADLPAGFDDVLTEYVETVGGGLFTVGGDKAYMQDDMQGTKYQDLLPVEANTDAKSLGLLIVIDSSGSMEETPSGTNDTRIELAKDAAIASINSMRPSDYVGVVSFNSTASLVAEMTPVSQKDRVISRVERIETATGTYYTGALNVARNTLVSFNETELKHIIFLTDGEPVDADLNTFMDLIDRNYRDDITLSTIALGPSVDTDIAEEMAERGGGRFYEVVDERELTEIMIEETTTAAGQYYNEGKFTPSIVNHTGAVAGISELPEIGGYYGTRLKDGATIVLGVDGSPLYAEWQRGAGRVGSFMSDLNGTWTANYFVEGSGRQFLNNVVNSLFPDLPIQQSDISVEFGRDNFTTEIQIGLDSASGGETVTAEVTAPGGGRQTIDLSRLSGTSFAGAFRTDRPGVYSVTVRRMRGDTVLSEYTAFMTFSYSDEYNDFHDDTQCFTFMESIGEYGNGKVLFSADEVFGRENETTESDYDPQLLFLILTAVLFLLDIVVRKFKFKWPHEIIRERRSKKQGQTDGAGLSQPQP